MKGLNVRILIGLLFLNFSLSADLVVEDFDFVTYKGSTEVLYGVILRHPEMTDAEKRIVDEGFKFTVEELKGEMMLSQMRLLDWKGADVCIQLIKGGYAIWDPRDCDDIEYLKAQNEAIQNRSGIWTDKRLRTHYNFVFRICKENGIKMPPIAKGVDFTELEGSSSGIWGLFMVILLYVGSSVCFGITGKVIFKYWKNRIKKKRDLKNEELDQKA